MASASSQVHKGFPALGGRGVRAGGAPEPSPGRGLLDAALHSKTESHPLREAQGPAHLSDSLGPSYKGESTGSLLESPCHWAIAAPGRVRGQVLTQNLSGTGTQADSSLKSPLQNSSHCLFIKGLIFTSLKIHSVKLFN